MFNPELSVGDLLTVATILVAATGLLVELRRERLLRRKALADKVRKSAGLLVAKVDRWHHLSQSLFEDLQPIITDADVRLVNEQDQLSIRDFFWRELFSLQSSIAKRIMDEEIEIAYADLYGFDPRIQDLFSGVIKRLRAIDARVFDALALETQTDILSLKKLGGEYSSAMLGNRVRATCTRLAVISRGLMHETAAAFGSQMRKLVEATDEEIEIRKFQLATNEAAPQTDERCVARRRVEASGSGRASRGIRSPHPVLPPLGR